MRQDIKTREAVALKVFMSQLGNEMMNSKGGSGSSKNTNTLSNKPKKVRAKAKAQKLARRKNRK